MFKLPTKIPLSFKGEGRHWVDLRSPNDGEVLTQVEFASEGDMQTLLKDVRSSQKKIEKLKPFERSEILKKVAMDLKNQIEFLAWVIASEGGKPLKDAKVEATRAVGTLELAAEEAVRLIGEMIPMERTAAGKDHLGFTFRVPIGPVLAISAFNHPLNLIAHQVGCAIASGCSVILKPASSTPISAHLLWEAFKRAELPEGIFKLVNADVKHIEKLVSSDEINFVSFVGSAKVGWEMRKKIAPGTRIAMEHGGQAAAILRADCDLTAAVKTLIKGSYYHSGQVCISTQKIFVHQDIAEAFTMNFKKAAAELRTGPATDEKTDLGPLIKPDEVVRIQKWIAEAVKSGAKVILGNEVSGKQKQFLSATIVTNVPRESPLMQEEIFGPVVCINTYTDEEELIEYLNTNPYVFESALYTNDLKEAFNIAKAITTMTLVINNHTAFRVDQMPFGGHKLSGLGMGGVKYSMEDMTRIKQVIFKT